LPNDKGIDSSDTSRTRTASASLAVNPAPGRVEGPASGVPT
jgi:hypothetical protein